jgi:hypothetical protein
VSGAKTIAEAQADPVWTAYIEGAIKATNAVAVSNAQKLQKFFILVRCRAFFFSSLVLLLSRQHLASRMLTLDSFSSVFSRSSLFLCVLTTAD